MLNPYALLIQRHETSTVPHYIDMDKFSREHFDKTLLNMHQSGLLTVVYSKAYLHEPLRDDEYPDKELHFMQVVGIEEKLRTHVKETMEKLKKMNIWLLSGDSSNRVVPVAYRSGVLDPNDNCIQIDES